MSGPCQCDPGLSFGLLICLVCILTPSKLHMVQPESLVRFRGMIQDMLGNEFCVGSYKVLGHNTWADYASDSVISMNATSANLEKRQTNTCSVSDEMDIHVSMQIVNGTSTGMQAPVISSSPALVLDDSCLIDRDLSNHVLGKVKEFSSIPNLHTILKDEGFSDVNVSIWGFMGCYQPTTMDTKLNLMNHIGVKSWFHTLQEACDDFVSDERIVWVDIEGVPLKAWSRETFTRIGKIWGETLDLEENADSSFGSFNMPIASINNELNRPPNGEEPDDEFMSDEDGVPETIFGSSSLVPNHRDEDKDAAHSDDPFGLYDLLKNKKGTTNHVPSPSLSHPPGFTPVTSENRVENLTETGAPKVFNAQVMNSSQDIPVDSNKTFSGQNVVKSGGSVLIPKRGYHSCMDKYGLFNAIYGTWLPTNSKILFIAIYAPQQTSCKRKLWDYISNIVGRWNGESIIMGDFNEVRSSEERRGSCFNPYSARYFDRFISNAGLVDVTLEGYAFTWAHPSASKMSKLDRFLVSDDNFQKSKVKWAVEGDENSKFFHGIINKRRAQLAIRGIFVDGFWETEPDDAMFLKRMVQENLSGIAQHSLKSFFLASGLQNKYPQEVNCWVVIGDVPLRVQISLACSHWTEQRSLRWLLKHSAPIDISFSKNARWIEEEHLLADLTSLMDSVTLSNSGDRWVCDLVSDGNFRVKEIRNYIDDLFLPHQAAQTR
ncbi:RNA-directed DNA polymerase, eukaryota [Tanacetum coccineum]